MPTCHSFALGAFGAFEGHTVGRHKQALPLLCRMAYDILASANSLASSPTVSLSSEENSVGLRDAILRSA